jgi:ferredoxin
MQINKLTHIYFSPTGTTKRIISAISNSIYAEQKQHFDLTSPLVREQFSYSTHSLDEALVLGVPVYEERVPEIIWDALSRLKGNGQAIMLVAVYGNIGYGIVFKELQEWALKAGFIVVGGATFVAQHSFSHEALPLSKDRPDMMDIYRCKLFAEQFIKKLETVKYPDELPILELPATLPLIAKILPQHSAKLFAHNPNFKSKLCVHCNACVRACPAGAIDPNTLEINKDKCLLCFACVRSCKPQSRKIKLKLKPIVKSTLAKKSKEEKFPELFI